MKANDFTLIFKAKKQKFGERFYYALPEVFTRQHCQGRHDLQNTSIFECIINRPINDIKWPMIYGKREGVRVIYTDKVPSFVKIEEGFLSKITIDFEALKNPSRWHCR